MGAKNVRVAVVTTHPIQYQVPWLRMLAQAPDIDLHVFFGMLPNAAEQGGDFGVAFEWDVPLLDGYAYTVLDNRAENPSLIEFSGCDTPGIGAELERGQFDAVIVNGWVAKMCLQALWACRRRGIPCIVRGEVNGMRPRPAWKRAGHRALLGQYAALLAIGVENKRYLCERGVPAKRIFDTPYCIDNDRFAAAADAFRQGDRSMLRARFGLEPDVPTFLFSGKFVDKKRPMDLVEACRTLVRDRSSRCQVLMVGDGPLAPALREAALGLPIRFAGFLNQSEIAAAYVASDCLVLPSDSGETWGLVVNEAMACGLPALVSSEVGCGADLVISGETGDSHACGDVQALGNRMIAFAAQPAWMQRMGERARQHVHDRYNFHEVVAGARAALAHVTTGRLAR